MGFIVEIFLCFLLVSGSLLIFKSGALFYGCELYLSRALNREGYYGVLWSSRHIGEACQFQWAPGWFHWENSNVRLHVMSPGLVRLLREESSHLPSGRWKPGCQCSRSWVGEKWLRCFKIHYLHCPLSSIFNLVFPTSVVPNVPKLCHLLSWLCLNLNLLSSARADEKPSPAEADEGWFGRGLLTTFEQTLSQPSCLQST